MIPFIIHNIYFSNFQLLLQFGILFWRGKDDDSNKKTFKYKKG